MMTSMLVTAVALTTAALLASERVAVRSSTDCPSGQDVMARLRPVLPDAPASTIVARPDVANVDVIALAGDSLDLRLRLVDASGSLVGDRRLVVRGDCAAMADTVAAVIATWETEPPPTLADARAASAVAPIPASAPPSEWRLFLGAGAGVAFIDGRSFMERLELVAGPRLSRLQARVAFSFGSARSFRLNQGTVEWRTLPFEATLAVRTLHPSWVLSLDAGLALGWAILEGRDFSPSHSANPFVYGGVVGLRFSRSIGLGRWALWVEGRILAWAQAQRATLRGSDDSASLPRLDGSASAGLSVTLF